LGRHRLLENNQALILDCSGVAGLPALLTCGGVNRGDGFGGAIARFINSTRLELEKYNIYITDIRPSMVDTGGYDSAAIRDVNVKIGRAFGLGWPERMFAMRPTAVAKAIVTTLTSESSILSTNMAARGQELTEQSR
jgi:hypothetical protein